MLLLAAAFLYAGPGGKSALSLPENGLSLQETYAHVGSCWTRPDWPEAEILNLPKKVCINKIGVVVSLSEGLPLGDDAALIIEGNPISGRLRINGAQRRENGWSLMGLFPRARSHARACGTHSEASVAVYVDIDEQGRLRDASPRIHGLLIDGSAVCPKPGDTVEILYSRSS